MKYLRERDESGEESTQKYHKLAERIDKRDRVILKNEEEREVFEEVFDRRTLMVTLRSRKQRRFFLPQRSYQLRKGSQSLLGRYV